MTKHLGLGQRSWSTADGMSSSTGSSTPSTGSRHPFLRRESFVEEIEKKQREKQRDALRSLQPRRQSSSSSGAASPGFSLPVIARSPPKSVGLPKIAPRTQRYQSVFLFPSSITETSSGTSELRREGSAESGPATIHTLIRRHSISSLPNYERSSSSLGLNGSGDVTSGNEYHRANPKYVIGAGDVIISRSMDLQDDGWKRKMAEANVKVKDVPAADEVDQQNQSKATFTVASVDDASFRENIGRHLSTYKNRSAVMDSRKPGPVRTNGSVSGLSVIHDSTDIVTDQEDPETIVYINKQHYINNDNNNNNNHDNDYNNHGVNDVFFVGNGTADGKAEGILEVDRRTACNAVDDLIMI